VHQNYEYALALSYNAFERHTPRGSGTQQMATAATVNRPEEHEQIGKAAGPCVMVLFGASGDLTKRKLVPALYNLVKAKLLPRNLRWWVWPLTL
jgi:hypothetical protein